ncbi:hypothetical protein [Actinosynnema sp. NPDC023587]|uniref:hypothetical protein n=1 Tax=Actinosynnema sp. NPDC023587 TaxID=3154695 RepID=UPI0033E405B8
MPRPSESTAPSNKHVPGWTSAVPWVGVFGLGDTHGRPVSRSPRRRPRTTNSAPVAAAARIAPSTLYASSASSTGTSVRGPE